MTNLITTLGPKSLDDLGLILPHEHIFVDLKRWDEPGYAEADIDKVVEAWRPILARAAMHGVTAVVECSPVGVGRRPEIDKAVSEASQIPVVVPTGIYREPWIPPWAQEASEDELYEWMLKELTEGIDDTGVQAAWIKLSAGDEGITDIEKKILRAAARAGMETNALIGSHTIKGRVVNDQLDIIEEVGYTPERFLWIHTQAEPDVDLRLEIAARGAWLEFDALGSKNGPTDDDYLKFIRQIFNAQYAEKLLLSHDQGWHDLDAENVFTYLPELFIPQMRSAGFSQRDIHQLTHVNPFNAFAR